MPEDKGLSWLGVEIQTNFPASSWQSHPHPLPNCFAAFSENSFLKFSKSPKLELISSAIFPSGELLFPPGAIIFQNSEWLEWPPPPFLTAPLIDSGTSSNWLEALQRSCQKTQDNFPKLHLD